MVSYPSMLAAYLVCLVYLVPYALDVRVSHHQAAFLMSILGVIDIFGNISFGWLTDRRYGAPHCIFLGLFIKI